MTLERKSRHKRRRKIAVGTLSAAVVLLVSFAGGIVFYKPPEAVQDYTFILRALTTARIVGDLWGLDLYLSRKNKEISERSARDVKEVMINLFTENVIRFSEWERPTQDLAYAYQVLRKEKFAQMSGIGVFLVKTKEKAFFYGRQPLFLGADASSYWKELRGKENTLPTGEMKKIYRDEIALEKEGPRLAQLLARLAAFKQEAGEGLAGDEMTQLAIFSRHGGLTPSLKLFVDDLNQIKPKPGEDNETEKNAGSPEGVFLEKYKRALEAFSFYDPGQFIERAGKLAEEYKETELAPILLYLARGVFQYDLSEKEAAAAILAELKEKYPASPWSHPENRVKLKKEKKGQWFRGKGLGNLFRAVNIADIFFSRAAEEILDKAEGLAEDLPEGRLYEKVLDENAAKKDIEHFIPEPLKNILSGLHVVLSEGGVTLYSGFKAGALELSLSGRGSIVQTPKPTTFGLALKLQDIRIGKIRLPRFLLVQAEKDFALILSQRKLPLEVLEIKYFQGGVKIVLKKKTGLLLAETGNEKAFLKKTAGKK